MRTHFTLLAVMFSAVSALTAPQFPLKLSANKRHLEDTNSQPFLGK